MTERRTPKAAHNKAACFSLSLPEWYRTLLPAIDPKSNSRALRLLVTYALENGAAQTLLGLPSALDAAAIVPAVLAGTTPAQQVGGYACMRKHMEVHGDPANWATTLQLADSDEDKLTDAELRDLGIDPRQVKRPAQLIQHQQAQQPTAQVPRSPAPAPAPSRSATSTAAETEALMLELQQGFGAPPR